MLYEAWNMSPNEGQEEFEEVSAELKQKETSTVSVLLVYWHVLDPIVQASCDILTNGKQHESDNNSIL